MLSVGQKALLSSLIPLFEEPENPYKDACPSDTNHMGWVTSLFALTKVERDLHAESLEEGEIEKVRGVFDRYITSMVTCGFQINASLLGQGNYPIHHAAARGALLVLNSLIKWGADVNGYSHKTWGRTPLSETMFSNQIAAARLLIEHGADVNKFDRDNVRETSLPIHRVMSPEMAALLVKHGSSINACGHEVFAKTALHWAAHCGRPDTIFALLQLGAVDTSYPDAGSALDVARKVQDGTYSLMMARGAKIEPWIAEFSVTLLSPRKDKVE
ncbi:MAG: ankyrin repeat domain-containing protein [Simkaniaceae bacterium]|nr:ankyrin repeat domain-containing protein [Simkaniaceae bacterium]